jgi:hypothetical protein
MSTKRRFPLYLINKGLRYSIMTTAGNLHCLEAAVETLATLDKAFRGFCHSVRCKSGIVHQVTTTSGPNPFEITGHQLLHGGLSIQMGTRLRSG